MTEEGKMRVLWIQGDPTPEDILEIDEIFRKFRAEKVVYHLFVEPAPSVEEILGAVLLKTLGEPEEVGDERLA